MRYIPVKTVRVICLVVLAVALLLVVLSGLLVTRTLAYIGAGLAILAVFFRWIWYRCPHCGRYLDRIWGDFCPYCGKRLDE